MWLLYIITIAFVIEKLTKKIILSMCQYYYKLIVQLLLGDIRGSSGSGSTPASYAGVTLVPSDVYKDDCPPFLVITA